MRKSWAKNGFVFWGFWGISCLCGACSGESATVIERESDAESHSHTDGDVDGDADGDADSDADSDSGPDSDSDTDSDSDSETDLDSDSETDLDSDSETDADSDNDASAGLTLYYIRHAETLANVLPEEEWTLEAANTFSDLGKVQVAELTDWLLHSGELSAPDKVLVSPTWRGQNTISPYLVEMGIQGEVWPELTEIPQEPATGEPLPKTLEPDEWMTYPIDAQNVAYREGVDDSAFLPQTYEAGLSLVMMARDLLLEQHSQSGKTVFIVGHAHAGKLLLGLLEGHDMINDAPENYWLLNTGVTHVEQDPQTGKFEVVRMNMNH